MNVKSVEKQEKSKVELVIEVSREEFEAAIDKVYKKQRGKISVPGFRKGHAPRKIIEGMYGSGVFYEDAINEIYPEAYSQAVKQENLDVVAWPEVEILDAGKDGFSFKAVVTVRPEVYFAVGLSGQVQHTAGCSQSGLIFAVNNDENAPIFKECDFGVIGDLNNVIPKLIDALENK